MFIFCGFVDLEKNGTLELGQMVLKFRVVHATIRTKCIAYMSNL